MRALDIDTKQWHASRATAREGTRHVSTEIAWAERISMQGLPTGRSLEAEFLGMSSASRYFTPYDLAPTLGQSRRS